MRNIKLIFIFLSSIMFTSCESIYLDVNNINCTLDKEIYSVNEDIVLSFNGDFDSDAGEEGRLLIWVFVYKLKDGEPDTETLPTYEIINTNNLEIKERNERCFIAYIIHDTKLEEFSKKLLIKLAEPGDYYFNVVFEGYSENYRYGHKEWFNFQFTIQDE